MPDSRLALPADTAQNMAQEQAKKVFRVQIAMGILGNDELMKLADEVSTAEGPKKAAQLRNRAVTIVNKYLDEE